MSLRSNVEDWVRSLRKIRAWLCGTYFCINCTSPHYFAPSFMQLRNNPKCIQTLCNTQNMNLGSNGADWVHSLRKIRTWLQGTNFLINCTSSHRFAPSFMQLQNHNKYTQTQWNLWKYELGFNGVDWVRSLRKIPTWLRGMNFCINCTSSPCFASSFMQSRNDPNYTQTLCNAPKHEFRFQWGGLSSFIEKNPDVTSWQELSN